MSRKRRTVGEEETGGAEQLSKVRPGRKNTNFLVWFTTKFTRGITYGRGIGRTETASDSICKGPKCLTAGCG